MNIPTLCLAILKNEDEVEEFRVWAFGNFNLTEECDDLKLMNKWNELHGQQLMLDPFGDPFDDIPKMINIWRKNVIPWT